MIVRPTVLILGAGASCPYGFPTGAGLKHLVLQNLRRRNVFSEYDPMGFEERVVREFVEALSQSGVGSVDSFLEHRRKFIAIGKTAIAQALIPFENESSLFVQENDWYGYLLNKLNAPPDRFDQNTITILTFNYDRSLEWYLYLAMQARFGIKGDHAIKLMNSIPIIHLYGMLGKLPWEGNGRAYDMSTDRSQIYAARDHIKIIHEHEKGDDPEFSKGLGALDYAQRIVFIGVGYNNRLNLQRLQPDNWRGANLRVFGSAYGMTDLEIKTAARALGGGVELGRNLEFGKEGWDALKFLRELIDFET